MSGCFGTIVIWGQIEYNGERDVCIGDAPVLGLLLSFNKQKVHMAYAHDTRPIDPSDFPGIQIAEEFRGEEVCAELGYEYPGYSEYTPGGYNPASGCIGGHDILGMIEKHRRRYCVFAISTKPLDLTEIAGYKDEGP